MNKQHRFILGLFIIVAVALPQLVSASDKRIKTLERQLKEIWETNQINNQRLAESLSQFDQVRAEIANLRGEIEKIRHESSKDLSERGSQLQKMDHRLSRMDERLADLNTQIKDMSELRGSKKTQSKKTAAARLLYEEAFSELTQKNYKGASRLFSDYIRKYPRGELADNAQYWKGECFFALGDYEKAILEFQNVIEKYPKGNKAAAAMLKQGYSFVQLKAYADAEAFFQLVISKYPKSPEAIQAREKLSEVKEMIKQSS